MSDYKNDCVTGTPLTSDLNAAFSSFIVNSRGLDTNKATFLQVEL